VERAAETSVTRRRSVVAAATFVGSGIALAAAFFPFLFNTWYPRDDEGVFVMGLRESLAGHGHLYSTIWSDLYGPFYYGSMSAVYRVIHQQPTLENGRWITLVLITAAAALLGASVWRLTKSLVFGILCEVAAFLLLVQVATTTSMHPGFLGVLLVAVMTFEVSSYASRPRTVHLVTIGIALGALLMTKINVGGLAGVALVFGLVVGSRITPKRIQILVGVATACVPVALVFQNIVLPWVDTLAVLVVGTIVGMWIIMSIDPITLARWRVFPIAVGAAATIVCCLAYPLFLGTHLSDELRGVFIRPLSLPNALIVPANVGLDWLTVVVAVAAVGLAVVFRSLSRESIGAQAPWTHGALAAVSLWVFGIGVQSEISNWAVARWLPILVAVPALAFCCSSPEPVRLALRLLVPLAALQVLLVYPVAGAQLAWGTVAMFVPCAIGLATGLDGSRIWRELGWLKQAGVAVFGCVALLATTAWPTTVWDSYSKLSPLDLPGAGLIRIDPAVASTLRDAVAALRTDCDTFYGSPNLNSFYIFTGLPPLTGMVANGGPRGLTTDQQQQVVDALHERTAAGKRVCILRDGTVTATSGGPLQNELDQYLKTVATAGNFTVSQHN
jgi:hypothetical protein